MNKKIIFGFAFIILLFSAIVSASRNCDTKELLPILKKSLYSYYTDPKTSQFTTEELKELLVFYLNLKSDDIVDCTALNSLINKYSTIETECTENWKCTEWGNCVENQQTRTCSDLNNCGVEVNKPTESQSCWSGKVGETIRITTDPTDQMNPIVYGNKIVWTDYRNGNADIYMYDLTTGKETRITTNAAYQGGPVIYKDKIVWTDNRNGVGNADIYIYDLTTGKETQITSAPGNQEMPHIYEDKIVWTDNRDGNINFDIYMYDLTTKKETKISKEKGPNFKNLKPRIHGDKIIWTKSIWVGVHSQYDVVMYDLTTGKETPVTSGNEREVHPDIYGDKIVYTTQYEDKKYWNLYVYDINTRKETKISPHPYTKFFPHIHKDKIVWLDYRSGNTYKPAIYAYDLATEKETLVTQTNSSDLGRGEPHIYENNVVWTNKVNNNFDIFIKTI